MKILTLADSAASVRRGDGERFFLGNAVVANALDRAKDVSPKYGPARHMPVMANTVPRVACNAELDPPVTEPNGVHPKAARLSVWEKIECATGRRQSGARRRRDSGAHATARETKGMNCRTVSSLGFSVSPLRIFQSVVNGTLDCSARAPTWACDSFSSEARTSAAEGMDVLIPPTVPLTVCSGQPLSVHQNRYAAGMPPEEKSSVIWANLLILSPPAWACAEWGWTLVSEKIISGNDRQCTYTKNGVRESILVSGPCPRSPC